MERRRRNTNWRPVDRYINGRLPGVLRRGVAKVRTLTSDNRFSSHTRRCSYMLTHVVAAACHYNRWWLRHFGLHRAREFFFEDLRNGTCGLWAWVAAMAWEQVRRDDEQHCNVVVFPRLNMPGSRVRCHAFVLYDGMLYDGDPRTSYRLDFRWLDENRKHDFRIARVTEGDGGLAGHAVVYGHANENSKRWCRTNWFPWSTRRARRLVDLLVDSYGTEVAGG